MLVDGTTEPTGKNVDFSPLSAPIPIPSDTDNLSPGADQINVLSRSFEDSRPRSLEAESMQTAEKESQNSKGEILGFICLVCKMSIV